MNNAEVTMILRQVTLDKIQHIKYLNGYVPLFECVCMQPKIKFGLKSEAGLE